MQSSLSLRDGVKIGNVKIKSPLMLAPMAGITDTVLRLLVRKLSPDCLLVTEMLSSEALVNNPGAPISFSTGSEEPIAFQLSGHKPDIMLRAAKIIEERADIIDINMGCPVNKVVKGGDGSALMRTPGLAAEIVRTIKNEVKKPVTVKFRLGWACGEKNFIEFGQLMQEAGADAITLHGRTRSQMYAGKASWEDIALLKKEIDIPLYANGDIVDVDSAVQCLEKTGADGLAIGRGALGNPFLFRQIEHYIATGERLALPALEEKLSVLKEHLDLEIAHRGEVNGIKFVRKFYPYYIRGVKGAPNYRFRLVTEDDYDTILKILKEIKNG